MRICLPLLAFAFLIAPCVQADGEPCTYEWKYGPDQGFPGAEGRVGPAVVWDPDGVGPLGEWLVIGGEFLLVGNVECFNVAAWDGITWHCLDKGLNDVVNSLGVFQGDLVAGGYFQSNLHGNPLYGVARWTGISWEMLGNLIDGSFAQALAVHGGELFAAGQLWLDVGGQPTVFSLARWNGLVWNGVDTAGFGNIRIMESHDGALIAQVSTFGGTLPPNTRIAQWDGVSWSSLDNGMIDGQIGGMAVYAGSLYVSGAFQHIAGVHAPNLARWDGAQWHPIADFPGIAAGNLGLHDNQLVVYGSFPQPGADSTSVAMWDGAQWTFLPGTPTNGGIASFASIDHKLIATGSFIKMDDAVAHAVVAFDGSGWHSLSGGMDEPVFALTTVGDRLIAGGWFWLGGRTSAQCVAAWDGDLWHELGHGLNVVTELGSYRKQPLASELGWNRLVTYDSGPFWTILPGPIHWPIYALQEYKGDLYAGGAMLNAGNTRVQFLARFDGMQWHSVSGGVNQAVNSMALFENDLIIGGAFTMAGGQSANHVARWTGNGWQPIGGGLTGPPNAMIAFDGTLVAAELHSAVPGYFSTQIMQRNGAFWTPMGPGLGGKVESLAVYQGELFISGSFGVPEIDPPSLGVARWDGTAWQPLGEGVNGTAVLAVLGRELILGGDFTHAGGKVSYSWARWGPTAILGDINGDSELTLADFVDWSACHNDPLAADAAADANGNCLCVFNSDGDADVDLRDWAEFQNAFVAAAQPG